MRLLCCGCVSFDPQTVSFVFTLCPYISAAWLHCAVRQAIIQVFGLMLNISISILGFTVIAVGNNMGDFVADYAVAKKSSKWQ